MQRGALCAQRRVLLTQRRRSGEITQKKKKRTPPDFALSFLDGAAVVVAYEVLATL